MWEREVENLPALENVFAEESHVLEDSLDVINPLTL